MSKKRYAKDPLLYVHQPHVRTPMARMQSNYRTKKRSADFQEKNTQMESKRMKGRGSRRQGPRFPVITESDNIFNEEMKSDELEENNNTKKTEERPKFKDMSLKEKIEYFSERPNHIPKMKCEIKTNDKTYRGIVTDFDGETVFIRTGKSAKVKSVLFNDIKRVRMLGL